jgi:hypothetical protein
VLTGRQINGAVEKISTNVPVRIKGDINKCIGHKRPEAGSKNRQALISHGSGLGPIRRSPAEQNTKQKRKKQVFLCQIRRIVPVLQADCGTLATSPGCRALNGSETLAPLLMLCPARILLREPNAFSVSALGTFATLGLVSHKTSSITKPHSSRARHIRHCSAESCQSFIRPRRLLLPPRCSACSRFSAALPFDKSLLR